MTKPAKNITFGTLAAFVVLIIAILIQPAGISANKGIGYYNQTTATLVPYSIAYISLAATYWFSMGKGWLRSMLRFIAILLVGLLLTPPQLSAPAHLAIASALVSFQMVLSLWFAIRGLHWIDGLLLAVEFAAGIAILFAIAAPTGYLLHLQIVFQLSFTALLVRAVNAPTDENVLSI